MSFSRLKFYRNNPQVLAAYEAWIDMTPEQRSQAYATEAAKGNGKLVRTNTTGYLIPMNGEGAMYVPYNLIVSADGTNGAALVAELRQTLVPNRIKETLIESDVASPWGLKNFKPARYTVRQQGDAPKDRQSRITNIPYRAKDVDSLSQAFGRIGAAEAEGAAVDAVKAAGTTWSAGAGKSFSLSNEVLLTSG